MRKLPRSYMHGVRILSSYIPRFFTAITLHTVITAVTPYLTLWLTAQIIRSLVDTSDNTWLWVGVTLVTETALIIVGGILRRIKEAKWERLYRVVDNIVADKLLTLDHTDVDNHQTQTLLSQVKEHTHALGMGLVRIPVIFQELLSGAIGIVSAVVVTWRLFVPSVHTGGFSALLNSPLAAAVLLPLMLTVTFGACWLSNAAQRITDRKTDAVVSLDRAYYALYDTMFDTKAAADMRLYQQDALITRHLQQADTAFFQKGGLKQQTRRGILRALSAALSALWIVTALLFVAAKTVSGAVGIDGFVQYGTALILLANEAEKLFVSIDKGRKNAPFVNTALSFLNIPHRMYQGSLTTEKRRDRDYELTFRHVSFCYPAQTTRALNDVNVTLRAGCRLAIVGENGSGKSTFVKLLTRLYDPDEGEILLNGIDIRKYRYAEYVDLISVVFQDFQLLEQPLGCNIAGRTDYDRDRVMQCLADVGFDKHLTAWKDGLETPLYRTQTPTLGDAQKLAIARALYKDAPLILLDEPTAALDPVVEAEIYENLDRIVKDRTAIFISHRLSSCRFCDDILVFDRGAIVQRGTHEVLLSQTEGKYYALWNAQAQYYKNP